MQPITGLTQAEVQERLAAGKINENTDVATKSIFAIVRDNFFTLFNMVNLFLAFLVWTTGDLKNLLFIGVVLANLIIGIYQEIKAKRALDKLSILTAQTVEVIRDGNACQLAFDELVLDDVYLLKRGCQIPADSIVVDGQCEVDESLLTGESDTIVKTCGSELLSGSFVYSGMCYAKVLRVGADGYAAQLNAQAKFTKPIQSEILSTLKGIIKFATIALIPIGLALVWRTYSQTGSYNASILSSVAAVTGMIPQGLILLTSSVMAIAATRLAAQKVLIQQMYCVESLARVNLVCLDKTGTITSGNMVVEGIYDAKGVLLKDFDMLQSTEIVHALRACVSAQKEDLNDTARALDKYLQDRSFEFCNEPQVQRTVYFSSKRKFSGCIADKAYVLGAAQFVLTSDQYLSVQSITDTFEDLRCLVVCEVEGFDTQDKIVGTPKILGFVTLADEIRDSAASTIAYFLSQGVGIRVISGDDPRTVSKIAQRVGIPNAQAYIDSTELTDDTAIASAAQEYAIFGRVTPELKKKLICAFKDQGHSVAMTGDGVNDVLALKEADCSVAMAAGSDAARNISDIVLGANDFSKLPDVVAEGRRSINNLTRSASLFLVKTVYSVVLAAICIAVPPYPFIPIQMSLISGLVIGLPSFVLALESNFNRVRPGFLSHVLSKSLPASLVIIISCAATQLGSRLLGWTFEATSTICTVLVCVVGVALIYALSRPFTKLRLGLLISIMLMLGLGLTVGANFFRIATLSGVQGIWLVVWSCVVLCLFVWLLSIFASKDKRIADVYRVIEDAFEPQHSK